MKHFKITFCDRDTTPDEVELLASDLDITPEQLIKRFIVAGLVEANPDPTSSIPGETLTDFLVKNGVLKP